MTLIAIADDDQNWREAIAEFLEIHGYKVMEAANGLELLKLLDTYNPDCLLVDLEMPKLDGLGVLAALQERRCETPAIVVTANSSQKLRNQCSAMGARDIIVKSASILSVTDKIRKVVSATK